MKRKEENDLPTSLKTNGSMDEIKDALSNYKNQLNGAQHRIRQENNTSAFMEGDGPLVEQPSGKPEVYQQESGQDGNSGISCLPEVIHTDIKNAMKNAGYQPNEKGMSYSVAWTASLACVSREGQAYMERIQYLKQMDTPPLPGASDKHQIYSFFDAVTLGMANYSNMRSYEKGVSYRGSQEAGFPGRVIDSYWPGYQEPLIKHTFISECTPETFIRFLQDTRENNKGIPFGVMIHYPGYTVSIGFDGNKWLATDHDSHYYTNTTDLLFTFLEQQSDQQKDGRIIAAMEVVIGTEHSLNIDNNAIVVNAKTSVCVLQALHLALQHGDKNIIADCIKVASQKTHTTETLLKLLTCKDTEGTPGFYMALQNGHSEAITIFIRESAAVIARCSLSRAEKAELLYELLASKRYDGLLGFYMTLFCGHSSAVTAFIQASAAAMTALSESEEERADLLYGLFHSMQSDNKENFLIALRKGGPAVQKAFTESIDRLSLSARQKAELKNPIPWSSENTADVSQ